MHCTGLRFHGVYGSWGRPDMALHLFSDAIMNNRPIDVYNYGDMTRDFTYIDDIISGTVAAIDKNYKWEVFNLASGATVPLIRIHQVYRKRICYRGCQKYAAYATW